MALSANEYQKWCRRFETHQNYGDPRSVSAALALGLAAEAGEVAGEFEKARRGVDGYLNSPAVAAELGDVLWFVARLADELGYPLENLFEQNINKLIERHGTSEDAA